MITIAVVLDESGLLKSCDIRGHAEAGKRGTNIVCAAVSVLARTAVEVLSEKEGITVQSKTPKRGELTLKAKAISADGKRFLDAAGTFLIKGLDSVAKEYPEYCTITVTS